MNETGRGPFDAALALLQGTIDIVNRDAKKGTRKERCLAEMKNAVEALLKVEQERKSEEIQC